MKSREDFESWMWLIFYRPNLDRRDGEYVDYLTRVRYESYMMNSEA